MDRRLWSIVRSYRVTPGQGLHFREQGLGSMVDPSVFGVDGKMKD